MIVDPIFKNTHSTKAFETNEEISCNPVWCGMTNTESKTTLNDKMEEDIGIGEELLYWKSNLLIEGEKKGAVKLAYA